MKTIRALNLYIDGTIYHTALIALPYDGSDMVCPACHTDKWNDVVTITQHGFADDNCIAIVECANCKNQYHVQYLVTSEGAIA